MRIDVERIVAMKEELTRLNRASLQDLELYEGGVRVPILPEMIAESDRFGMNNADFVVLRCWERNDFDKLA